MTGITARGATGVGLASLVAAGSGYLVLVVVAQVLGTAGTADFLAFWSLLFFLFGALGGMQSEITRAVHVERTRPAASRAAAPERGGASARALPAGLTVGAGVAALVAVTSPLWAHAVLGENPWAAVAVVVLATLAFAGHSAVAGALAGDGTWSGYSLLVGAEAAARLLLVAVAAFVVVRGDAAGLGTGLRVATGAAAATWVVLAVAPRLRNVWSRPVGPARPFVRSAGQAMVGAASSAALVVGFPVLVRVTTPAETYAAAAPLLFAVLLTRAPLLIPLNAYQGVAITHFLENRGARPILRVAATVVGAGLLGAVAAGLVGPWLMAALLGPEFRVGPLVLALLTVAASLLALLTLTGAATLALGGHRAYAVGWLVATVCSAAVLLVPGQLEHRVVASLAAGPFLGVAVHALWVRRALRPRR